MKLDQVVCYGLHFVCVVWEEKSTNLMGTSDGCKLALLSVGTPNQRLLRSPNSNPFLFLLDGHL